MLLGAERITPDWPASFAFILALTLAFSSISVYRINRIKPVPSSIKGEAKVVLAREWGKRHAILLDTGHGRFVAYQPPAEAARAGSLVWVDGAVFDLSRAEAGSGFDEFLFWRAKGAGKKMILLKCHELERPSLLYRLRDSIRTRAVTMLPQRTAGYLLALVLGERTADLTSLHKSAGTLHLLAVSGFHVGIFAWVSCALFHRGWPKVLVTSSLVWLYILLAGAPPGGMRAALMLQVWLLSLPLGRPSFAFNSVSLAGVILLLYEPWYFFDVGWRLSMLAALFLTASARLLRNGRAVASPLVWLVTAPQSALLFGGIPLVGLFINSLAVPLFLVIFPLILALSLPLLLGVTWSSGVVLVAEYILMMWERFSTLAVSLFPWSIGYTAPLLSLSVFIFCVAAMGASGFSKTKIAIGALIPPIYLLLYA